MGWQNTDAVTADLLSTLCSSNCFINNLNFVILSLALFLGFQNAHIIIIPKKNPPGLIQKWGRVLLGEVTTPYTVQT